jgi:hypothetical protein
VATLIAAAALSFTGNAWAQKKYTISEAPASSSKYLQEHAIDAGDMPGHQHNQAD